MPHSSGGGSHSSGSHYSSSHSSSGSSAPERRTSDRPFPGAARYYYYDRAGHLGYIYSDTDPSREYAKLRPGLSTFLTLLVVLPLAAIFVFVIVSAFLPPTRLSSTADASLVLRDEADQLTEAEETRLRAALTEFYEQTGVIPAVVTGWNEDWSAYAAMEDYAYDLYVNAFPDEDHWLLVYTTARDGGDFDDWNWEGMQGDRTDSILTESVTEEFTDALQRRLTARSRYTVGEAFIETFEELNPTVMEARPDWGLVFGGAVLLLFLIAMAASHLKTVYRNSQYKNAGRCPPKVVEDSCAYCGCAYVIGTVTSCPHCGAPIPAHNE